MSSSDWQEIIGVIGAFALVIGVVTVGIWQLAATWRAKAQLAREKEYRSIADRAVLVQEGMERQLIEIAGQLTQARGQLDLMQERLDSLERILKEVE
jgi:phage shock protein A